MVVVLLSDFMSPGDVRCDNMFCGDSLSGPGLAEGCLQDGQFPDASLYEYSRHTRFVQCLAQNSQPHQNLNVLVSTLQM